MRVFVYSRSLSEPKYLNNHLVTFKPGQVSDIKIVGRNHENNTVAFTEQTIKNTGALIQYKYRVSLDSANDYGNYILIPDGMT